MPYTHALKLKTIHLNHTCDHSTGRTWYCSIGTPIHEDNSNINYEIWTPMTVAELSVSSLETATKV